MEASEGGFSDVVEQVAHEESSTERREVCIQTLPLGDWLPQPQLQPSILGNED